MSRLCAISGGILGATVGGWLGSHVGIMTAYIAGVVGLAAGVYLGRRIVRDYID